MFDLYAWKAPRDLDPAGAAALVDPWLAAGADPAASPFEPSSDTGWFARELARDAPAVDAVTDSPPWDAKGPFFLHTEPAPPARIVAMRLGTDTTREDLEEILGLATKYDLVLYDARSAKVLQPLEAMSEHASATFWPRGAIQAAVAGIGGAAVAVVAYLLSIPIVSGIAIVVGGFLAVVVIVTFVAEGCRRVRG